MNITQPLSREAIEKSKQDIDNSVQDTLLSKLISETNEQINAATIRNQSICCVHVPAVVFGYPAYSVQDVTKRLKLAYEQSGFKTSTKENTVYISW